MAKKVMTTLEKDRYHRLGIRHLTGWDVPAHISTEEALKIGFAIMQGDMKLEDAPGQKKEPDEPENWEDWA